MIVYTDKTEYAESLLTDHLDWRREDISGIEPSLLPFIQELNPNGPHFVASQEIVGSWTQAFIIHRAPLSQFDLLVKLCQKNHRLPDRVLCLAGTGQEFHGQKGRPWAALEGNIHLTIHFAPNQKIEHFHVGFLILAAVSLVESIDALKGLTEQVNIKWVNDVLINRAKVAGFIVHTSSMEETVTAAVVGIGLNVEKTPQVQRDIFVPKVASLRSFIQDPIEMNQKRVLQLLLHYLDQNYEQLLSGQYSRLLDIYRNRSLVIGRKVKVLSDEPEGKEQEIASGRVKSIGENLELYLENVDNPVTKGRLILED